MSEEALSKSGQELFRELLRLYGTAEVEDYHKVGQWRDELMRTDLVLIEAHRKEAGAPDPPELDEVIMPEMPSVGGGFLGGGLSALIGAGAPIAAGGLAASLGQAGGHVAELRLIALFVSKWKLDPAKSKALLAKLSPQGRRHIITNFKITGSGDATLELDKYIAECERDGSLANAAAVTVAAAQPAVQPAGPVISPRPPLSVVMAGMKRPLMVPAFGNPALDPSKRPRLSVPGMMAPGMRPAAGLTTPASALAARLAAQRAQSMGGGQPGWNPAAGAAGGNGNFLRNLLQNR